MGSPKALLRIGNHSFIRHICGMYKKSDADRIVVVTQPAADAMKRELEGMNAIIVPHPGYKQGQLSSIIRGIAEAEKHRAEAVLVHPVDHPAVGESVVNLLIEVFRRDHAPLVIPKYHGDKGHPVLFASRLFDELRHAPPDIGARDVVWKHPDAATEVEVDDNGVTLDIDTREDYENLQRNLQGAH